MSKRERTESPDIIEPSGTSACKKLCDAIVDALRPTCEEPYVEYKCDGTFSRLNFYNKDMSDVNLILQIRVNEDFITTEGSERDREIVDSFLGDETDYHDSFKRELDRLSRIRQRCTEIAEGAPSTGIIYSVTRKSLKNVADQMAEGMSAPFVICGPYTDIRETLREAKRADSATQTTLFNELLEYANNDLASLQAMLDATSKGTPTDKFTMVAHNPAKLQMYLKYSRLDALLEDEDLESSIETVISVNDGCIKLFVDHKSRELDVDSFFHALGPKQRYTKFISSLWAKAKDRTLVGIAMDFIKDVGFAVSDPYTITLIDAWTGYDKETKTSINSADFKNVSMAKWASSHLNVPEDEKYAEYAKSRESRNRRLHDRATKHFSGAEDIEMAKQRLSNAGFYGLFNFDNDNTASPDTMISARSAFVDAAL